VGTSQTVTWSVAGTTGNGVNAANVDILLSTDGGNTYPITLAANTPNDGSQAITVPNNVGTQNRVMVKGSNHIFFDISNTNFTIAGQVACTATVPTGLAASNVGSNSATLSWNAVAGATYDVQYRVVGTSTWTTVAVSGVSTSLSGLATSTQYEAQVRSKCSGGSNSAYSSSVNFTTTAVQLNYCASASTNTNDEYISRVQLNTINNPSGAQFYSNFTNISTTLNKSTQYTITVTPTWTGAVYAEGYSVWIDYNGDGDFTDAGEQVWTRAATNTTPVSGSFTVPAGATDGATRMRVSMKYNAIPTACETFTYGEVEDTVNVTTLSPPDTQAPSAPTNLTASGTTQTTTNLSWNASTDNVGVTGYDVYRGATLIASVTGTTYQATGLSPNTSYTFSVRAKDAAGNVSSTSNSVNVTTLVSTVTYCASQGNNTNDEWIQRVQLGSINNNSGNNGGYADFTSFSTTLVKGTSNTVTITPAWSGTVYREAYRVWIDYNQDGDFNDSGEQVYNRTRTNASVVSGSFTVPTSAVNGATRMRVSMKYNASPTSCETFAYGEVEDYTVIISASGAKDETIRIVDSAELSVYPNPVKGSQLNLVLKNAEATEVTIYNMIGQVVSKQAFNTTIDVSNLKGGIYIVEVIAGEQRLSKRFIKE
uniref:GEVED domain-containing protein n=1 Tax=Gelidibacter sp. TaxID=2018083 RepID=UPI00404B77ED